MKAKILYLLTACMLIATLPVKAEPPWIFENDTRYMALGDSLAAGYGAQPATQGYVYLLYKQGVFDKTPNTLFANAAVPGATSADVLAYQVPQAVKLFRPHIITLTVGGNDLLTILGGADPNVVLPQFQANLFLVLWSLRDELPDSEIIVSNLYSISEIPGSDPIVSLFNQIVAGVAMQFNAKVADVFSEFDGRNGLLLIERNGAGEFEVHPTNAGYRAMADAFERAFNGP